MKYDKQNPAAIYLMPTMQLEMHINDAITTSTAKSFDNNPTNPFTSAPNTLRMPISFVLLATINVAKPNKPMQAIKIEMAEA